MLEIAIEATACHPPAMLEQGGQVGLTRRADKRDGSKSRGPC